MSAQHTVAAETRRTQLACLLYVQYANFHFGAAIELKVAHAIQHQIQPAVQQATQMYGGAGCAAGGAQQAVQAALQPMQQEMAAMRQALAAMQHEQQAMRACHRNGHCCSRAGEGAFPIQWPRHDGAALPAQIAGRPRPATRDEVQAAAADVIDGMLSWHGLPAGPPAGSLHQRRKQLLARVGIYV